MFFVLEISDCYQNIPCILFCISALIPCRPSTQVGSQYGKRQWTSSSKTDRPCLSKSHGDITTERPASASWGSWRGTWPCTWQVFFYFNHLMTTFAGDSESSVKKKTCGYFFIFFFFFQIMFCWSRLLLNTEWNMCNWEKWLLSTTLTSDCTSLPDWGTHITSRRLPQR